MGSLPEERDAYLRAQVEPGEAVLAIGSPALVTDRRILFAWRLNWPPHTREWTHDAIAFDEITTWSEGRRHDERPILRIDHPSPRPPRAGTGSPVPVVSMGKSNRGGTPRPDRVHVFRPSRPRVRRDARPAAAGGRAAG
jgi:hypothetical protein